MAKPQAGQVVTFCKPLDDMLGGGVACGEITEFCMYNACFVSHMCTPTFLPAQVVFLEWAKPKCACKSRLMPWCPPSWVGSEVGPYTLVSALQFYV